MVRACASNGDVPISDPILVRNCPPEPEIIVLRSDGEIGGGGSACQASEEAQVMVENEAGYLVPDPQGIDELNEVGENPVGVCSDWQGNFGCRVWVIDGKYIELCAD